MPNLSFEELVQVADMSSATLNRRLAYIKEHDPAAYRALLSKEGRTKYYDTTLLLGWLRDWKGYAKRLQKPAPAPPPAPAAGRKKHRADLPKPGPSPRRPPFNSGPPPPAISDGERDEKLTRLLETPAVLYAPTDDTLNLFRHITDPRVRERVEYAILICECYAAGQHTMDGACEEHGVPPRTFYEWVKRHAEIATLYKRAKAKHRRARRQLIGEEAQEGLLRLVKGEEWDEVTVMYKTRLEPDGTETRIKVGEKVTRKRTMSSVPAVIFSLTNAMERLWKQRQQLQVGPTQTELTRDAIDKMTPEERREQLLQIMERRAAEAAGAAAAVVGQVVAPPAADEDTDTEGMYDDDEPDDDDGEA